MAEAVVRCSNIVSLGKMVGKTEPFSWRSAEDELAVKYLENLDV